MGEPLPKLAGRKTARAPLLGPSKASTYLADAADSVYNNLRRWRSDMDRYAYRTEHHPAQPQQGYPHPSDLATPYMVYYLACIGAVSLMYYRISLRLRLSRHIDPMEAY